MSRAFRLRHLRLGATLSPGGAVVATAAAIGGTTWSRAVPAGCADLPAALADALAEALGEAMAARGATAAHVAVALAPPLVECRFLHLPGLHDEETRQVLARDVASWFPTGGAAQVVAAARPGRAGALPGMVLAAAAPAAIVDAVHDAAARAGATVDVVLPAEAALACAGARAWPAAAEEARTLVARFGGRVELLGARGGELVALRRLPAVPDDRFVLAALAHAAGDADAASTPDPLVLLGDDAATEALAAALAARGHALATDGPRDALALAAAFAGEARHAPRLVPERLRREERRRAVRGAWRRAAAAGLLLALAAGAELWGARRELAAVQGRRAALRGRLTSVLATRDTLAQLAAELGTLRAAEGEARRWSRVVTLLAAELPRDAHLLSLRAEGDSVVVEGVARRAAPVMGALERHPAVLAVRAQGSIRQELSEDAGQVERFTLLVRLMPDALGRGAPAGTAARTSVGTAGGAP